MAGAPDIGVRIKASGSDEIRQQFALIRRDAEDALVTVDRVAGSTASNVSASLGRSQSAVGSLSSALSGVVGVARSVGDGIANVFALGLSKVRESAGEVAAAGGLVGAGMVGLVYGARTYSQSVAEAASATGDLADQLSLPIEALSRMQAAFRLEGGDDTKLGQGLTTLRSRIVGLAEGSQTAVEAFDSLGLSMRDFRDGKGDLLGTREAFDKVIDRIALIKNPTLQAKVAMDVLGQSVGTLGSFASTGAAGLREAEAGVAKFGTTIDEATREVFDEGLGSQVKLVESLKGVGMSLARVFFPFFSASAEGLSNWLNGNREKIEGWLESLVGTAERVKGGVVAVVQGIFGLGSGGRRNGNRASTDDDEEDDGGPARSRGAPRPLDPNAPAARSIFAPNAPVQTDEPARSIYDEQNRRDRRAEGSILQQFVDKAKEAKDGLLEAVGQVQVLESEEDESAFKLPDTASVERFAEVNGQRVRLAAQSGEAELRRLGERIRGVFERIRDAAVGLYRGVTSQAFSDFVGLLGAIGGAATEAGRSVLALGGYLSTAIAGITGARFSLTGAFQGIGQAFRDFRAGLSVGFATPWIENLRRAADNVLLTFRNLAPYVGGATAGVSGILEAVTGRLVAFTGWLSQIPDAIAGIGPAIARAAGDGGVALDGFGGRLRGFVGGLRLGDILAPLAGALIGVGFLSGSLVLKVLGGFALIANAALFAGQQTRARMQEGLSGGSTTAGPASLLLGGGDVPAQLQAGLSPVLDVVRGFAEKVRGLKIGDLLAPLAGALIGVGFLSGSMTLKVLGGLALIGNAALFAGQQARGRLQEGLSGGGTAAGPASLLFGGGDVPGQLQAGLSPILDIVGGFARRVRGLLKGIDVAEVLVNFAGPFIAFGIFMRSWQAGIVGALSGVIGLALMFGRGFRKSFDEAAGSEGGVSAGPASLLLGGGAGSAQLQAGLSPILDIVGGFARRFRQLLGGVDVAEMLVNFAGPFIAFGVFMRSWQAGIVGALSGIVGLALMFGRGFRKSFDDGVRFEGGVAAPASFLADGFGDALQSRLGGRFTEIRGSLRGLLAFGRDIFKAFAGFWIENSFLVTAALGFAAVAFRSSILSWLGWASFAGRAFLTARQGIQADVDAMKAKGAEAQGASMAVAGEGAKVQRVALPLLLGAVPAVAARLFAGNWKLFAAELNFALGALGRFGSRVSGVMAYIGQRLGLTSGGGGKAMGAGVVALTLYFLEMTGVMAVVRGATFLLAGAMAVLTYTVVVSTIAIKFLVEMFFFAARGMALFYAVASTVAVAFRTVFLAAFVAVRTAAVAFWAFMAASPLLMVVAWGLVIAAIAVGVVMIFRHFGSIREAWDALCRRCAGAWGTVVEAVGATGEFLAEIWREGFFTTMGKLIVDLWHGFANMGIWAWNKIKSATGLSKILGETKAYGSDEEIQDGYNKSLKDLGLVDQDGNPTSRRRDGPGLPKAPERRIIADGFPGQDANDIVQGADGQMRPKQEEQARLQAEEDRRFDDAQARYQDDLRREMTRRAARFRIEQAARAEAQNQAELAGGEKPAEGGSFYDELKKRLIGPDGTVKGSTFLDGLLGGEGGEPAKGGFLDKLRDALSGALPKEKERPYDDNLAPEDKTSFDGETPDRAKDLPSLLKRMETLLRESGTTPPAADDDPYGTGLRGAEERGEVRVERRAGLDLGAMLAGLGGGLSGRSDFADGVPEPIILDAREREEAARRRAAAQGGGGGQDLRKVALVVEEGSLVGTPSTIEQWARQLNELGIRTRSEPVRTS